MNALGTSGSTIFKGLLSAGPGHLSGATTVLVRVRWRGRGRLSVAFAIPNLRGRFSGGIAELEVHTRCLSRPDVAYSTVTSTLNAYIDTKGE